MFEGYADILSVSDVMKALCIGRNSVYQLLRTGKLHHLKIGRKYLIPKPYLIEFIASNRSDRKQHYSSAY